jgi:hypothetical protein
MTRAMSKYEKAFRTRGGESAAREPIVDDPDDPTAFRVLEESDEAGIDEDDDENDAAEDIEQPAFTIASGDEAKAPVTLTFSSSNIKGAELDVATGIVTVAFKNDTTYRYANFTAELMAEWGAAASAGSWFHQKVRMRAAAHPVVTTDAAPIADVDPAKE